MPKVSKAEREEAREFLAKFLKPGTTVRTINRHTSASGMTRFLDVYVIEGSETFRISWSVARLIGWTYSDKYEAVKVEGCGMDMGFHLVYVLSATMFPDGFDCIAKPYGVCSKCYSRDTDHAFSPCEGGEWLMRKEGCPSNDHSNGEDNAHHESGGYALRQAWL